MDRKNFIKKTLLGAAGIAAGSKSLSAKTENKETSTYDKLMDQVGFNHLPNKEVKTMKSVLHKANTRGHANHGWLDSHHSFSFANYYNPERMNFGVLRVLNDDIVAPGRGFGLHPHDNMEIISIPLEGDLEHKDSMGNVAVIKQGDVDVRFLQIWMFPNQKNVTPRYDQIPIENANVRNDFQQVLSPSAEDAGVWAHQNAWFHIGNLDKGFEASYGIKSSGNGVYAFVLEGNVTINGQTLEKRDGFGVWDTDSIEVKADSNARVLLMDVPMQMG